MGANQGKINKDLSVHTEKEIGSGAFGMVFEGVFQGKPCAVKVLHKLATQITTGIPANSTGENEEANKAFDRECEFLKSFQHPNVVRHYSTEKHPKSGTPILVTELMDCNLRSYLADNPEPLNEYCQVSLSKGIASGLSYIHSKCVIHRDLCGDNILLKLAKPVPVPKISDFGMSRVLDPSQLTSTLTAMGHRMGYLPPEASRLDEEQYDKSLDVFSLGVTMVQIVNKLETVKSPKDRATFVAQIPEAHVLKPLINKCLQEDMRRRPSAQEVCDDLSAKENELVRRAITRLLKQDLPLRALRPPLTLNWRSGKDMPIVMGDTVQSVVIGDTVYVGGGGSDGDTCTVMALDLQREQWSTLPKYSNKYFAMTSLDSQLVLVGGRDPRTSKRTNQVSMLEANTWTQPHPPMNIARHSSTAVSFNNHIIVAGGFAGDRGERTCSVEIYDVASRTWFVADPLPNARNGMKSALIGSTLFLMGGLDHDTKVVDMVDLNELIDNAVSKATKQTTPTLCWQAIGDTPLYRSSPLSIGKSLLALGGCDDGPNPSSSIHLYQPDTESWVKVGELPSARYNCTCSVLPASGDVIVAGGSSHLYFNRVDFLSIS